MVGAERKRNAGRPRGSQDVGGSNPTAKRARSRGGRSRQVVAASPGRGGKPRGERRLAFDVHLTAPAAGKGDRFHHIEKREPFKVPGIFWTSADGEKVPVDIVVEELRAQLLIPEEALARFEADLKRDAGGAELTPERVKPRARERDSAGLKPERVQGRDAR